MKTRKIEVYLGFDDHTWDTKVVDIPADTPEMWEKEAAEKEVLRSFGVPTKPRSISFIGIYNSDMGNEEI